MHFIKAYKDVQLIYVYTHVRICPLCSIYIEHHRTVLISEGRQPHGFCHFQGPWRKDIYQVVTKIYVCIPSRERSHTLPEEKEHRLKFVPAGWGYVSSLEGRYI